MSHPVKSRSGLSVRQLISRPAVLIGAGGVTLALFALMTALISEEFTPQDTVSVADLAINPTVEDIPVHLRTRETVARKQVETPPPPPRIDIATTERPAEPLIALTGAKPAFPGPVIEFASVDFVETDRDAQPITRIPPQMPPRAQRSGRCKVRFNVSPDGQPYDVTAHDCTERLFERPTIRSVQRWRYRPKIRDGRAVARQGVETTVTFRLTDEAGRVIH